MGFTLRTTFYASAATIGIAAAVPGWAQEQTAPSTSQTSPPTTADEAEPATQTDERAGGLGEIVVTARRRTENLQSVPVAVTSFSNEALEQRNIRDITQIGAVTPSVSISQAGYSILSTVVAIRGQRTSDITLGQTPSIGIYVDDVYRSTTNGLAASGFADATNVEVLKGPQGTLYGRNTTGGAIKVTTTLPDYDETSGRVKLGVGNYDTVTGFAGVSVPLVQDRVALRLTALGEHRNGFGRDTANDRELGDLETFGFTGTLRARVADDVEAILRGGYNEARSGSNVDGISYIQPFGAYNIVGALQNGFITPADLGPIFGGAPTPAIVNALGAALTDLNARYVNPTSYRKEYNVAPVAETSQTAVSLTLNYDVAEDTTLKSISSYQRFTFRAFGDLDASPIVLLQGELDAQQTKQYTQEVQLSGSALDNRLSYALGYFYFRIDGRDQANVTVIPAFGAPTLNNRARVLDTSHSGYLQATYEFIPSVSFTGGIRYTDEKTEARIGNTGNSGAICQVPVADRIDDRCFAVYRNSFSDWSYTAGLDWKLRPNTLLYVKTSRGFKAGGQNIGGNVTGGYDSFDPETVTDYELGFKSEFFDRVARLNVAAFRSNYNDIQRVVFIPGFGSSVNLATLNAASAKIEGVEAELTVQPIPALVLGASGSYTRARYKRFIDPTTGADRTQERFAGVPKWLASTYVTIEQPTGFGSVSATVDGAYQSSVDFSPGNHLTPDLARFTTQDGYTLVNGRLTFRLQDPDLDIAVFGRNLFDERFFSSANDYTGAGLGIAVAALGARRTIGVELTKRF